MSAHRFWQIFVPPEGKPSTYLQIGELNLRSAIGVDPTYPAELGETSNISNRASNILGIASLSLIVDNNTDDNFVAINLPFPVKFFGGDYSTVFVCSNSFMTFGTGSGNLSTSATTPPYPTIHINSADRSYQRVYAGIENGGSTFRVRFEGSVSTSGISGSPTVEWEVTFTRADPRKVLIDMGTNAATGGTSLITNGTTSQQVFASGTVDTGYTFNYVDAIPIFSASSAESNYLPKKAFDSNIATWWQSNSSFISESITCDFQTAVDIVELAMTVSSGGNPSYQPTKLYLRYSDDGVHFVNYYASPTLSWSSTSETKTLLMSSGLVTGSYINGYLYSKLYNLEQLSAETDLTLYDYEDKVPFCSRRFLGGLFGVQGSTTSLGIPTAKRVDLVDQKSGQIVATRNTGKDGEFKFKHIIEGEYSLVGVDNTGDQNSVIFAHVVSVVL